MKIKEASEYLGVTNEKLIKELKDGKSSNRL